MNTVIQERKNEGHAWCKASTTVYYSTVNLVFVQDRLHEHLVKTDLDNVILRPALQLMKV